MNPRSSRPKAPARRRPLLETLEARQMLSVSVVNGALIITGTSGDDTITVSRDPVTKGQLRVSINGLLNGVDGVGVNRINISALEGNDLILIDPSQGEIALPVNIAGGSGNDTMTGGSGADILQGGRGNDVIRGSAGSDLLEGGVGNDFLYGGDGRDSIDGGAGADALYTGGYRREVVRSDALDTVDRSVPNFHTNTEYNGTRRPNFFNGTPIGLTPAQVRAVYNLDSLGLTGAGQTIAIVDAFDDPTVRRDLATFSTTFGLPAVTKDNFQVYYATKQRPNYDAGWAGEISLDVQWAHAIAPDAKIILVEANSSGFADFNQAIDRAVELVHNAGGGVVSMSFGGTERFTDPLDALHYHNSSTGDVSFVASTGDGGADVSSPAVFPDVTAVGGTFLDLDPVTHLPLSPEQGWTGSGGGISSFFPRPDFQAGVTINGAPLNNRRAVPDVAFLADPRSGVAVFNSSPDATGFTGWQQVGGTSLAAPMFAAFVTLANEQRANLGKAPIGAALNTAIYNAARADYAGNFNDQTSGTNGYSTFVGYDLVTGLGTPKPALVTALANDNTAIATGNVIFSAARLALAPSSSTRPASKIIFGGTGSASKSGNSWDIDLVPNARSGVSIAFDGPLSPNSDGVLVTTGVVSIVLDATHTQTFLIKAVAREDNGQLIGEFYAVSSRGRIIYQGTKPAFYGTFNT
jgi:hypothetical protein